MLAVPTFGKLKVVYMAEVCVSIMWCFAAKMNFNPPGIRIQILRGVLALEDILPCRDKPDKISSVFCETHSHTDVTGYAMNQAPEVGSDSYRL